MWYTSTRIPVSFGRTRAVLKVSEAASLALHTMVALAMNLGKLMTTSEIAAGLKASEAHLSKVMQRLAKAGLVRSVRGPHGGFTLNRRPEEITLLEIYELIDGPFVPSSCLFAKPVCDGQCILGGLLKDVNQQVREHFAKSTLSDFMCGQGIEHEAVESGHQN
jgi:Rrf2 family protein